MSSTDCTNCYKLNEVISEQKNKINLIEIRLKDLVKAYKKVSVERDNLLAISSSAVLPLNDSHEQQKRLSCLEASVADMSAICGKYESQRIKDKQLIEELTQKCEQMANELKCSQTVNTNTTEVTIDLEKTFRQRGTQTEEWFESEIGDQNEKSNELWNKCSNLCKEVETQTEIVSEFDAFNGSNRKKTELAVVLPTLSETQQQIDFDFDCEQSSDRSRSRSQSSGSNLDNYPVFASNAKEMAQNNDSLFLTSNSSGVSLFYANELARKEIDLAETRLQAREYECALREVQWKYNTEKYRLQSRINDLEKHFNSSLMSSNLPMSPLNITYIRNVLIKLLNTKDKQQKQFMINAILTALEPKKNEIRK